MPRRVSYAPQVACPSCGAAAFKMCRSPRGRPSRWPHVARQAALEMERPDLAAKQREENLRFRQQAEEEKTMNTQRLPDQEARVLGFIRDNPGCTARQISIEVFGGDGDPNEKPRKRTHQLLRQLSDRNLIVGTAAHAEQHNAPRRWNARVAA